MSLKSEGIETRVELSEYRSKYSLILLPNFSLQLAFPWMFTQRNVNYLVFASLVMIPWKFRTCLDHLRWESEAIPFKIVNDVSFYSLQSALVSAFTHRDVNSFHLFGCGAQYITVMSSSSKSQCQRRVFEDNNIKYWPTPAESPDMNPLKLPWHELKTFSCVALSSQLTRTNLSRASIGSGTLGLLLSAVNTLATSEKLLTVVQREGRA